MTSSHGTDRVTTRNDLCDNPCFVFVAPLPPATSSGEDFQSPHRLRDSTMHRVHSKPNGQNQTEDSQIRTSSERWPQNNAYDTVGRKFDAVGSMIRKGMLPEEYILDTFSLEIGRLWGLLSRHVA